VLVGDCGQKYVLSCLADRDTVTGAKLELFLLEEVVYRIKRPFTQESHVIQTEEVIDWNSPSEQRLESRLIFKVLRYMSAVSCIYGIIPIQLK
jgi:hypothetical protein